MTYYSYADVVDHSHRHGWGVPIEDPFLDVL